MFFDLVISEFEKMVLCLSREDDQTAKLSALISEYDATDAELAMRNPKSLLDGFTFVDGAHMENPDSGNSERTSVSHHDDGNINYRNRTRLSSDLGLESNDHVLEIDVDKSDAFNNSILNRVDENKEMSQSVPSDMVGNKRFGLNN